VDRRRKSVLQAQGARASDDWMRWLPVFAALLICLSVMTSIILWFCLVAEAHG
jgi:hypothetical protein